MLLDHPEVASMACTYCQEWLVDIRTGKIKERRGEPQKRPEGAPTPCHECPKGSPENAKEIELSDKNWATVRLFVRNRALMGRGLNEAELNDPMLRRNFGLVDTMLRQWESKRVANSLGTVLSKLDSQGE